MRRRLALVILTAVAMAGATPAKADEPEVRVLAAGAVAPAFKELLIDFARDCNPGRSLRGYATQARAPLFDTAPFELRGRPTADGRGCELWAVTPEGTVAMSAEVELAS